MQQLQKIFEWVFLFPSFSLFTLTPKSGIFRSQLRRSGNNDSLRLVFVRVIGLPSEEDWPQDSPVSYSSGLSPHERPGAELLQGLDPDANDLLSVSAFHFVCTD